MCPAARRGLKPFSMAFSWLWKKDSNPTQKTKLKNNISNQVLCGRLWVLRSRLCFML